MKINNLYLKDFKNIKENTFDFNRINLISGQTGHGKSAILESLVLVLCNHTESKLSDYVRWNADKFIIECNFEHLSNKYNYKIECGRTGSAKRYLCVNEDENSIYLNSDVSKYMKENILDPAITLYSSISMQHKSTELLFDNPSPRLQKLKQILKIDILNNIVENIKDDITENKSKLDILEAEKNILENRKFHYEDLPNKPDENLLLKLQEDKKDLERREEIYLEEQKKYEVHKEKLNRYTEAEEQIEKLTSEEKELSNKLEIERNKFKKEEEFNENEYQELTKEIESIKNEINDLKEYIQSYDFHNIKVNNIKEKLSKTETELSQVKKGICPFCKQELKNKENDEIDKFKNDLDTEAEELTQELDSLGTMDEPNYERKAELENELKNKREKSDSLISIKSENEKIKNFNKELQKDIDTYEVKILECKTKIKEYEKIESPGRFMFSVSFNKEDLSNVNTKIDEILNIQKDIDRINKFNEKTKLEEKENKEKVIEKVKEIEELNRDTSVLKETQNIINKDFSSYLIEKGCSFIQKKMNDFFQRSYGKYYITFQQDKSGVEFYYSENNEDFHNIITLSGFEKQLFSLSFRLALSQLQNIKLLLIDEVDSDSSVEKSLALYSTLLTEDFNQLFCITHREDTKEMIHNLKDSEVFEIENGNLVN